MKILGINGNFVDNSEINESSVALIEDGKVIFCVAEERLSRKKMDGSFPNKAIEDALSSTGNTIHDIDHVAISSLHPAQTNKMYFRAALSTYFDTGVFLKDKIKTFGWNFVYNTFKNSGKKHFELGGKKFELNYNDHHMCHAAGAYYCSPFNEALVITLDGGGDGLDGGAYIARGNKIHRFMEIPHFQSPGTMYSAVTTDLGFKRHRHEGKITGLAAFGNPDIKRLGLHGMLRYDKSKGRFISEDVAAHHRDLKAKSKFFYPLLQKFPKEDLAAVTQQIFENEVLAFVKDAYERAKKSGFKFNKICLAGGCFANVKLNQRIYELGFFDNIYVFPAMGDDGLSVGAGLLLYYKLNFGADKKKSELPAVYLGKEFSETEMEEALKKFKLGYNRFDNIEIEIAKVLAEGKVVARYNGRMEYGPRALGNRSVIAAPFDKSINDWLNKKFARTEFMPFAPSMTAEHAGEYLEGYKSTHAAADFMTITYEIKKGIAEKMPAVVHVDNTARPQVVRKTTNPSYHKIITEFHKLTGIACVLNTSFNMHEEPIVYSPEDGIRGFLDAQLDYLAMGNFLVPLPNETALPGF